MVHDDALASEEREERALAGMRPMSKRVHCLAQGLAGRGVRAPGCGAPRLEGAHDCNAKGARTGVRYPTRRSAQQPRGAQPNQTVAHRSAVSATRGTPD